MISKAWSRKSIAACVSVAVLSVYSMVALASPRAKAPSGQLSISGQVTVNGQNAISGGTLFSDSVIVTSDRSNATVSVSKLGRIELAPNSSLTLSFSDKTITGLLDSGIARVSTLAGVSVNLTTKEGSVVVDGSQATSFSVNASKRGQTVVSTDAGLAELREGGAVKQIAAGENATAGTPNPDPDDDHGLSGGALAALLLAAGGAIVAVIIIGTHDDEFNFGGSPIVISPSR